jgi:hypothetical protein
MAGDGPGEGADASDASDDQGAEAAAEAAEAAGAIGGEGPSGGEGFGGPGFGVSSTDDAGLGVGWGQAPTSVAETAAMEDISTTPTPTATEQTAATEDIGAKKGALANAIAAQEEAEEIDWPDVVDKTRKGLTFVSLVKDTLVNFNPYSLAATVVGSVVSAAISKEGRTDATADPDTSKGATPADPGQDPEADEPSEPAPAPDTSPEGIDSQRQRSAARVNRAASNNTTLAVSEEDDFTRQELRRARRQITRFA